MKNLLNITDAYKLTHWMQTPLDTEIIYSYLESRGGQFNKTVFFGLQYLLKKYFVEDPIWRTHINQTDLLAKDVFGHNYFNKEGFEEVMKRHGGKLPIRIKAVPEGSVVDTKNVLMTIENTDPDFPFLTNYFESLLLQIWYPITVTTLSFEIKKLIKKYCDKTGCLISPFHLNDFGLRGCSSTESAAIGGMAHLLSFTGTDNLPAIQHAKHYYQAPRNVGGSVIAAEHSTITVWGKEDEYAAYEYILNNSPPEATISLVVDSYNIWETIKYLGTTLKENICNRPGKVVFRGDSGDPIQTSLDMMNCLSTYFGCEKNKKGYDVLNPRVGIIYGDGINYDSIDKILDTLTAKQYAASNIVFGMGGGLLQQVNRDTQKFAIKCSAVRRNGEWIDVFKDPVGDSYGKKSKAGRLMLTFKDGKYKTEKIWGEKETFGGPNLLEDVFVNGDLVREYSFPEIQNRLNCQ